MHHMAMGYGEHCCLKYIWQQLNTVSVVAGNMNLTESILVDTQLLIGLMISVTKLSSYLQTFGESYTCVIRVTGHYICLCADCYRWFRFNEW